MADKVPTPIFAKRNFRIIDESIAAEEIVEPTTIEEIIEPVMEENIPVVEEVVETINEEIKENENMENSIIEEKETECNCEEHNETKWKFKDRQYTFSDDMVEGYDYVVCKECGKKLRSPLTTHIKIHNLSVHDYLKKYPHQRLSPIKDKTKLTREQFIAKGMGPYILGTTSYSRYYNNYSNNNIEEEKPKETEMVTELLNNINIAVKESTIETTSSNDEIKETPKEEIKMEIKEENKIMTNEETSKATLANSTIEERLTNMMTKLNRIHKKYLEKLDTLNYLMDEMELTYASIFKDED